MPLHLRFGEEAILESLGAASDCTLGHSEMCTGKWRLHWIARLSLLLHDVVYVSSSFLDLRVEMALLTRTLPSVPWTGRVGVLL